MVRPPISIIGLGRLGQVLARACQQAGYPILPPPEGELIFLTVPDRAIAAAAAHLAQGPLSGKVVIHCSGGQPATQLEPAARAGARIGVFHPLQTFATPESPIDGCFWGIEADPQARAQLEQLARDLGGHPFDLTGIDRPLYHAAAVMIANYTVTLAALGEGLLRQAGLLDPHAAAMPLLRGAVRNLETLGPARALTGPVARGDAPTVNAHEQALAGLPEVLTVYRALKASTLQLARTQSEG